MTSTLTWNVESLRDAQKSLTRTRICDAARDVFNEYGYSTVIHHGKVGIAEDRLTVAAETFERFFSESSNAAP